MRLLACISQVIHQLREAEIKLTNFRSFELKPAAAPINEVLF